MVSVLTKYKIKKSKITTKITTRISVVIITREKQILLVRHRKGNRLYWVLPGGRLEYGETFEECAIRELKEETGLDVAVDKALYLSEAIAPDRSRHIVNIFFKGHVTGGTIKLGNEPVLAGVNFFPVSILKETVLFPPVGKTILQSLSKNFEGDVQYLGNLWV